MTKKEKDTDKNDDISTKEQAEKKEKARDLKPGEALVRHNLDDRSIEKLHPDTGEVLEKKQEDHKEMVGKQVE